MIAIFKSQNKILFVSIVVILVIVLTGSSCFSKPLVIKSNYKGSLTSWSNKSLGISFKCPSKMRINIKKGRVPTVTISNDIQVTLSVSRSQPANATSFRKQESELFDNLTQTENRFHEYTRSLFSVDGAPAGYIEYRTYIKPAYFLQLSLDVLRGSYLYEMDATLGGTTTPQDVMGDKELEAIRAIFSTLHMLPGKPNLASLSQ